MAQFNIQPTMVFPSTKMESVNKLITEGSLTRLINKLIDTDSYIIPPDSADLSNYTNTDYGTMIEVENTKSDNIEFLLHGYYFNMGNINNLVTITDQRTCVDILLKGNEFEICEKLNIDFDNLLEKYYCWTASDFVRAIFDFMFPNYKLHFYKRGNMFIPHYLSEK